MFTLAPPLMLQHDCCTQTIHFQTIRTIYFSSIRSTTSQALYFYKYPSDRPLRLYPCTPNVVAHPNFKRATAISQMAEYDEDGIFASPP